MRLNWHGTYGKTFWLLWIGPLLGFLSFGILLPLIYRYSYRYFAENHSYGTTRFSASPTIGSFYWAFFVSVLLPMIFLIAISFVVAPLLAVTVDADRQSVLMISAVIGMLVFYLFLFPLIFVFDILCRNLLVRSLVLGDVAGFHSTISPVRFIRIFLSNLVAILLPWAKVRMYRYLCACTSIGISGNLDRIIDEEQGGKSAFGEEFAEMEGVDFGV
uniref:DUF898 domain-containing protein n=1 Tax=Candidatus Kentrum eta TaxID=2126337 RepID=A0A450UN59_9GAMM|nr:MAG: protein of unknown function (DUF898) [Candidatus Kentron sp. H]VFJ94747.1 MAG: protein of unknown function (DUF898) [Candidatus Kentron sp. H]VFK01351.1 MAG: protein of unknown function (DUF898) [Candidatus Kentron sp. H]